MKKIFNILLILLLFIGIHSCEIDNYTAPEETLQGQLTDTTGNLLQLEQGAGSARMKLEELKYANPVPLYLNIKQDGSFKNSKLFAGKYRVFPVEGPFYPVDSSRMQIVDIHGITTADFEVVPYLKVEWVGEPVVLSDKKVSVSFKFTRYPAPAGMVQPNLLDYQLFISTTQYVGNNNYDNTIVGPVVTTTNAFADQVITITSKEPMKYSTTFYLRVGVRVNDSFKKYNYTDIKTIIVP